jgi:hypothetical protein
VNDFDESAPCLEPLTPEQKEAERQRLLSVLRDSDDPEVNQRIQDALRDLNAD